MIRLSGSWNIWLPVGVVLLEVLYLNLKNSLKVLHAHSTVTAINNYSILRLQSTS